MLSKLFFLLITPLLLWGVTLKEINSYPKSNAKNFYIWQFLQQSNTSEKEATQAFYQIRDVNNKLFLAYAKKSSDKTIIYTAECMRYNDKKRETSKDLDCVKVSLSHYKASKLSKKRLKDLRNYYHDDKDFEYLSMLLDSKLAQNIESYPAQMFLDLFNNAGGVYRLKLNVSLSQEYLYKLSKANGFNTMVRKVTTNNKLNKLQKSLLKFKKNIICNDQTSLFLALNFLRFDKKEMSLYYLNQAFKKAYYRSTKDRALFWIYQTLKDKDTLEQLASSWDINIYSLYAKEALKQEVTNFYSDLETSKAKSFLNLQDPFEWNRLVREVKRTPKKGMYNLAKFYNASNLLPIQSFIVERASSYKRQGFIMPYNCFMKEISSDKKALMYSLMRQESRFIPSALSHSFAMGTMQIMPFLVKALNKTADEKINDLTDMFNPKYNIAFASEHLKFLHKSLYHPLFVAYAYNGGIGFTKRHLLDGTFLKGKYEPFMSMEMMANTESREYGKKVLANYVMYKMILGEKVSIHHLFDTLTQPDETDRFRG
jgi:soluble lytic murein transglycosylase